MAEEHAGGQHDQQVSAERRARQKLLFAVPIIPIVMFIVAPCALFLFTADLALPRIRIEYARRDGDRDAPASTNAGSFVIRNCQWSLDLLDAWARMGPRGPVRDRYGKVFAEALSNRGAYEADDQSALVYLLVTERGRWGGKVFLESSYLLHGFWEGIVDRYEEMRSKGRPGLGDNRGPLVAHFVGCKPCGEQSASYGAVRCRQGMERALNFADDQILGLYGFQHESLNTTAVRRVRNDTGRPLDADDEQIGRLLHPEFRAAKP
uniref:Uncharacterized protein n=1 Tax=Aegilops tauschii TaxID=37682 RepID=M8BLX1_AEGTA